MLNTLYKREGFFLLLLLVSAKRSTLFFLSIIVICPFIRDSEFRHIFLDKILGFMLDAVVDHQVFNVATMFQLLGKHEVGQL